MKKTALLVMCLWMLLAITACKQGVIEKISDNENMEKNKQEMPKVEAGFIKDSKEVTVEEVVPMGDTLLLATTTSTHDSGLLDFILGDFTQKTGIEVKVIAVGTGKALQMGRDGEADCLLVHAKTSEEAFVAEGYGTERFDVMYNDFIFVGPSTDPAGLKAGAEGDVVAGLKLINGTGSKFLSRGDDSGTNKKELSLWKAAGLDPSSEAYYNSTGKGMGDTLVMADEMLAYTMTDRATYLNMQASMELEIVLEGDPQLFNQYGVIPVNPETNNLINHAEALTFVDWLLSDDTQQLIASYGVKAFGAPLFTPNATK